MALPIAPTPILYGEDAERFLQRIKEQEKEPKHKLDFELSPSFLERFDQL